MSEFNFEFEVPAKEVVEVDGQQIVETSQAFQVAKNLVIKRREYKEIEEANAGLIAEEKALADEIKRTREEYQKKMDALRTAEEDIRVKLYDVRKELRERAAEINRIERLLAQALENERNAQKVVENRLIFDKRVKDLHYMDRILPHQTDGAYILATNMRCILGDKRGAGKTLTAIAAWDMAQCQRILVIVPDDVVSNFTNEIKYWAPHRTVFTVGRMPKIQRDFALSMAKQLQSFVIVVNYSAWRKDNSLLDKFIDLRFDTVVWDEAHEIKNTSTNAYRGVKKILLTANCCPKCSGPVEKVAIDRWSSSKQCTDCGWDEARGGAGEFLDQMSVKMAIPMTGTVILNKPQDIFAQLSLIDPVHFVEQNDFLRTYCEQNLYTGKWQFKRGGLDRLQKELSGKYIARPGVKTPTQTIITHDIDLDPERYPKQRQVIEQLSKHAQIILESGKKMNVLYTITLILRKRQANVWPGGIKLSDEEGNVVFSVAEDVHESAKVDKCIWHNPLTNEWEGLIPEFTEDGSMELGANVVVFSQFKDGIKEIEKRCKEAGIAVVRMDGDTPQRIRDEIKIDFDRKYAEQPGYEKKWQVVLCNYKTGGVGLNFTTATETIILDKEWNPGKEDQAFGRTDRLGQTEETNVHIIRLANTIDDWMDALNDEKKQMIAGFESTGENITQRLLDAMKNGTIL